MNAREQITVYTSDKKRGLTVSKAKKPAFSPSTNSPVDQILYLQRTIGNRAVQRLIKSGAIHTKLKIGQPLLQTSRDFFGPRFGASQYSLDASSGRHNQDHELTRVIQQSSRTQGQQGVCSTKGESNKLPGISLHSIAAQPLIQRWRYGGWREARPDPTFRPVSRAHQARVDAAMRLLSRIVSRRRCRNYFRDNCPGGTARTLTSMFFGSNRMAVWALRARGELGANVGSVPNVVHVAYEDPYLWQIGHWAIAGSLLHEMMHGCGIGTSAAEEVTCETAIERCHNYTPFIESVTPASGSVGTTITITGFGFGMSQGRSDRVLFNGVNAGAATVWRYGHGVGSEIQITVPARAKTGPLVVINNGVRSNARQFRVTP